MICEKIMLKEYYPFLKGNPILNTYCPENYDEYSKGRLRKVLIILPGGGYQYISMREAEPIALQYTSEDIAAFVLEYSVGEFVFPTPIDEVLAALLFIKDNALKYHVDKNDISLLGFSAGGHLAASTIMYSLKDDLLKLFNCKNEDIKFAALLLGYPVINCEEFSEFNTSSARCLDDPVLQELFSIEKHVTEQFPNTFIFLTSQDRLVPPYNSLSFAQALVDKNVPVELHMYPLGNHGLALADNNTTSSFNKTDYPDVHTWIKHSIYFLRHSANKR